MRNLLILLFIIGPTLGKAQSFRPSIEPFIGGKVYHLAKNHELSSYPKGFTGIAGLRGSYHFGNYIALNAGFGFRTDLYWRNMFALSTLKVTFLRTPSTGFSAFVESGIEISEEDEFIPVYLGTNQYFGKGVSLNFRLRIPSIVDVEPLSWSNRYELGIEFGLQFDLHRNKPPKPLTGFGNPFILQ